MPTQPTSECSDPPEGSPVAPEPDAPEFFVAIGAGTVGDVRCSSRRRREPHEALAEGDATVNGRAGRFSDAASVKANDR